MSLPQKCPVGPQRKRRSKKNLEGPVVKECLQFLKQCSDVIYTERRNTGAVKFQDGGFIQFGKVGAADIFCLVKADRGSFGDQVSVLIHVEIECKRADGKGSQSPDQIKFQEFCNSHHIPYILCTSAKQLKKKIKVIVLDIPN